MFKVKLLILISSMISIPDLMGNTETNQVCINKVNCQPSYNSYNINNYNHNMDVRRHRNTNIYNRNIDVKRSQSTDITRINENRSDSKKNCNYF